MPVIDKWAIYDHPHVAWEPHKGQLIVAESRARHRVISAGRRFGKSDLGGHELLPEALFTRGLANELLQAGKRREFWIVGPEYSDAEKEFRVLWNLLRKLEVPMDHPGSYNNALGGDMHISLWGGAFQCHAKSSKYPDTLVGEGLSGVIMAEAAKQKELVWTKYIRPTLADFDGWSIHSSTPEGKNHFYDKYLMGQDPANERWESWKMPAWRNHFVYKTPTDDKHVKWLLDFLEEHPEKSAWDVVRAQGLQINTEIIDMIEEMYAPAFSQEIGADFTEYVGKVFKRFDADIHVGDLEYNPNWTTVGAVDYGFTNPNVWLLIQIGPWNEINVVGEVYKEGLTNDEFADEIVRRGLAPGSLATFFPDPEDPGSTRVLEKHLRVKHTGGTGGELKWRLDAIRKALKTKRSNPDYNTPPWPATREEAYRPQLMIDRSCHMLIHDMEEYKYPDKKEFQSVPGQEKPQKKDDHGPEALGRFFAGYFGTPQSQASRVRSTTAKMSRNPAPHRRIDPQWAQRHPALAEKKARESR